MRVQTLPAYQPQIASSDRVREEFGAAATKFSDAAREGLTPENLETALSGLQDERLPTTYARHLPLVHRFVTAEMDTDAPSKRGMGRLAEGDPPPRLGAKYRKQLRDEAAQRDVGLAAERLIISGFAGQAAFFSGENLQETADEDAVWLAWLRHLIAYYQDTTQLVDRARNKEESSLGLIGAMLISLSEHGGTELMKGFEAHGVIRGRRMNTWHNARALTYFILFVGAGRALHHVLSDAVDPDFGAFQSLHLLEDYAEKRGKRQMIAEA